MATGPLHLTILGSATPYPRAHNACSGYLVSSGDTRLWVDAGTGTLTELQRYTRLEELAGIWISHMHADHLADLLTTYYAILFADLKLTAPIPLYGPPGIADRLAGFLTNTAVRSPVESAFAVQELSDGHHANVGSLTLTTHTVAHGIPAFAVRVEAAGISLVYSGDTAPCASLTGLAEGCVVLLCEAGSSEPTPEDEQVHHTPEQAGATASAARAGRLIVTHVDPFVTPDQAVARAGSRFDRQVGYAAPGTTFPVG